MLTGQSRTASLDRPGATVNPKAKTVAGAQTKVALLQEIRVRHSSHHA
jgi:hypothetical protein